MSRGRRVAPLCDVMQFADQTHHIVTLELRRQGAVAEFERWHRRLTGSAPPKATVQSPTVIHARPGRRIVTSWTSHALPSGSLKAKNDP